MHATSYLWPFTSLGIDIVEPFEKATAREYNYILGATDYFSKWAEAITVRYFTIMTVSEIIRVYIIDHFGVPETIMADTGQAFKMTALYKLYAKYVIKGNHSSRYYASVNGLEKDVY